MKAGAFELETRSEQKTKTVSGFMAGDVVAVKVSCFIGISRICDQGFWAQLTTGDGSKVSFDYRITGQRQDNELTLTVHGSSYKYLGVIFTKSTCTPFGE